MYVTPNAVLYSLAAIYIALTESMTATYGRDVEPLANRLIKEMLRLMDPDAAEMCGELVKFTSSNQRAAVKGELFPPHNLTMH
jgi:hypothetical protein